MNLPKYGRRTSSSTYSLLEEITTSQFKNLIPEKGSFIEFLENFFSGKSNSKETNLPHQWEYVIVFLNPDCDSKNTSISFAEAERIYSRSFIGFSPSFYEAFKRVFNSLKPMQSDRAFDSGGKLKIASGEFLDTGSLCQDFLTLIRNITQYVLESILKIKTHLVLSSNGRFIYMLLKSNTASLLEEAENVEYDLQMKEEIVDPLSLEPCDDNLRPLSFLKCSNENVNNMKKRLTELEEFKDSGNQNVLYESEGVSEKHWESYAEYLSCIYNGLKANENYKKLSIKTKSEVNQSKKKKDALLNLWDRLGFNKPIGPYSDFKTAFPTAYWKAHKIDSKGSRALLRNVDRLKLLPTYLSHHIALHYLKHKKIIEDYYPLHNFWELKGEELAGSKSLFKEYCDGEGLTRKDLIFKWNNSFFNTNLPLNAIRNYYGEKIGLYFAFLSCYGKYLAVPSFVGIGVFVMQRLYSPYYYVVIILNAFYSIYMTCVAVTLLELWKRKQSGLSIEWGQTDYEEDEVSRPQFSGTLRRSPVNDDMEETYYPTYKQNCFFISSMLIIGFLLMLALSCLAGILILRKSIINSLTFFDIDFGGYVCSILNAIQIQIFNFIFNLIVIKLNQMENWRTQSEYDNSLIIKTYIFQFVNSFSSLYYIAFIKTHWEGCLVTVNNNKEYQIGANCMDELYIQLLSLFIILLLKNIVEILLPVMKFKLRKRKEGGKKLQFWGGSLIEEIDNQHFLPSYDSNESDGTVEDFLELAIMFGYITLFAVAFPLSSFLTYLAILLEIQVDRFKLLYLVRRPQPVGGKTIGVWQGIFTFNCTAAIFTNVGIICFTIPALENWDLAYNNRYLTYTFSVLLLIGLQWTLVVGIPDQEKRYEILHKRHRDIVEHKIMPGQSQEVNESAENLPNFTINTGSIDNFTSVS